VGKSIGQKTGNSVPGVVGGLMYKYSRQQTPENKDHKTYLTINKLNNR